MTDESLPLITEIKAPKYFYFAAGVNAERVYQIEHKLLDLVPMYKNMLTLIPNGSNTEETAVHIKPVYIRDECKKNPEFWINTIELFDVIMEYINNWKDTPIEDVNYIKKDIVQTGYANQILKTNDLKLILKFTSDQINKLNPKVRQKMEANHTIKKYHIISCLNPLLKMVDGFLQMSGFADKIYAYIATIIWNCSLKELDDVSDEAYFHELEKKQLAKYNEQIALGL